MNLPKPAFATEEEQLEGGAALAKAGDTTKENVEKAVSIGDLIWDTDLLYVRYLKKDDELLYHVFRGPGVPKRFWGQGDFGVCLLIAAEAAWHLDKPKIEFVQESCRQEVYEDNPLKPPAFPPHFYTAYLCIVPGIDRKLMLPDEKIKQMCELLEQELKKDIARWSNGN